MRLALILFLQILLATSIYAQNKIVKYEYWFDGDYAGRVATPVAPVSSFVLNTSVTITGLTNGVHTINVRFRDSSSKWSNILSQFFYKMEGENPSSDRKIVHYEYWFDGDYANKTGGNIAAADQAALIELIPVGSISDGIHTFNIRFKDNNGLWSSILSLFVYRLEGAETIVNRKLTEYEYWFDNDFNKRITNSIVATDHLDLTGAFPSDQLANGVHTLNIRFKDNSGLWSVPLSRFFYSMPQQSVVENKIEAWRYWLDGDFSKVKYLAASPSLKNFLLMTNLDLSTVPSGKHGLHIQFKDALGLWSSITTDTIERIAPPVSVEKRLEGGPGSFVQVYPNPTAGMLRVDFGSVRSSTRLELIDFKGRILSENTLYNTRTVDLPVSFPAGIYILRVISGDLQEVVRIVKQ